MIFYDMFNEILSWFNRLDWKLLESPRPSQALRPELGPAAQKVPRCREGCDNTSGMIGMRRQNDEI